ncbi:MAG: hypothetical protein ABID38_00840 [Candidatus Diapherotrites archaeon]
MNKKGQIFSLDFILSLTIIILAIGLMLQFMELQEYNQREAEINNELYSVGETATLILMSKPSFLATDNEYFSCRMAGRDFAGTLTSLAPVMGCIPLFTAPPPELEITKEKLGIPSDYSCNITGNGSVSGNITAELNLTANECGAIFDGSASNVYSSTRDVVFLNGTQGPGFEEWIFKKELYHNCIRDNDSLGCPLEQGTITLKVWKNV